MSERQQRSYHHSRMAAAAQQQHQVSQTAPSNLSQSILSQHPHLFNAATSNHLQQAATAAAAAHQSNAAASMNTPHQPRPYFIDLSQIRQVWLSNQNSALWGKVDQTVAITFLVFCHDCYTCESNLSIGKSRWANGSASNMRPSKYW